MKQAGPLLHDATTWRRRRCSLPRDDVAGRAPPRRLYTKFRWSGSLMWQCRLPALEWSKAHLPPRRKAQEPHPHLRLCLLAPRLRPLPHTRGTPEWAPVVHPQLRVAGTVRARHRLAEDLHMRSWCPAPLPR